MATNNGVKKKPAACGACDTKVGVKYKCKDCEKLLCENCKTLHQKVKATKKHVIVDRVLKKKGKDSPETKNDSPDSVGNGKDENSIEADDTVYAVCPKHKNVLLQWYCNSCCAQVCRTCISIDHESHVIAEITTQLKKRERKLEKYLDLVEDNLLNDALDRRKKAKSTKVEFDNTLITMKREIWLRYDELMMRIGQQRDELMKQLDEIQKSEEVKFVRATETIEREVSTLEQLVVSLRDMFDAMKSGLIQGDLDDVKTSLDKLQRREPPNPPKVTFKTQNIPENMISGMYGKLETKVLKTSSKLKPIDTHSPMSSPELEITVLSSFSTNLPFVKSLCPVDDKEAWIACWQCDEIQKITNNGIKNNNQRLTAMDLAHAGDGDVMIAAYSQCVIKCLRSDGIMTDLKSTSPLYPTGIYISESGDLYVSLVDRYDLKVDDSSVRRLVKMDRMCNTKLIVESNQHGDRLFTYPAKVTVNTNNDICVVDETGQYTGRLVVVDQNGDVRFTYGEVDLVSGEKCDLSSCACDEEGRILVTDWLHHKIHLVSKEGYFMGFLMCKEDGIYFPFSLGFSSDGSLWIGCKLSGEGDHGDVVRINYKL